MNLFGHLLVCIYVHIRVYIYIYKERGCAISTPEPVLDCVGSIHS